MARVSVRSIGKIIAWVIAMIVCAIAIWMAVNFLCGVNKSRVPHWHITKEAIIDDDGDVISDLRTYSDRIDNVNEFREVIITVDKDVPLTCLVHACLFLDLNYYLSNLKMSNGAKVRFYMGFISNYLPIYLAGEDLDIAFYAVLGECRRNISRNVALYDEDDDGNDITNCLEYIRGILNKEVVCEPIPNIKPDAEKWFGFIHGFTLFCDRNCSYGQIEEYLIQAAALGYDMCTVKPFKIRFNAE